MNTQRLRFCRDDPGADAKDLRPEGDEAEEKAELDVVTDDEERGLLIYPEDGKIVNLM
jgi:hypothetical protein